MSDSAHDLKASLRTQIRDRLKNISPAVWAVEAIDLCRRLEPQLASARTILFFAPMPDELDVWPLLETYLAKGKTCALPAFDTATQAYSAGRVVNLATDIASGKFEVREPAASCAMVPLETFDLVLVPGLAFDLSGQRLGRGKGFYDRLLAQTSGIKCGVCHDFQLLAKIPAEPHDARVNFIFTPMRSVRRQA